ncbi:hypothetical protein [Ereboglobus luteus]|uniref:hypothetical protein n=1 Tax=Ereboglobus luteus TaxID=1796921 RepID=UPI001260358C|nr:hypothetical protein [Ereboglobus luteus]
MSCEAVNYIEVHIDDLFDNPDRYNGQPISVAGIYAGYRDMWPILYKNISDFTTKEPKIGIRISGRIGRQTNYINVKNGAPVIIRGIFRVPEENMLKLFFADIIDVASVTGGDEAQRRLKEN